jgi:hypothetical protein
VDTAREGIFAGIAQVAWVVKLGNVSRGVKPLDGDAGKGCETLLTLGRFLECGFKRFLLPA